MNQHDRFCDWKYGFPCTCERIAMIRADERYLILSNPD